MKYIIHCSDIFHRNKPCILLSFEKSDTIHAKFKKLQFVKFSKTHGSWYMPKNKHQFEVLKQSLQHIVTFKTQIVFSTTDTPTPQKQPLKVLPPPAQVNTALTPSPAKAVAKIELSTNNIKQLQLFIQQLQLKAYSHNTITTYRNEFIALLQILKNTPVQSLSTQKIKDYLQYCLVTLKLSENTLHSRINALKFYYEQVLKREKFFWDIPRPKKQIQLPRFFNQDEIASIINATTNIKHKCMLMLTYSAGMRVSEVVALKTNQIDSKRMCIYIQQAKGKKDRMVSLSAVMLVMLREYAKTCKLQANGYLFEGQQKNEPYSTRSLQLVLNQAKQKARIIKPGSIHALRHSFATHLIDKGTDVTMIQKLLGHNDLKTTLRYLHTTNKDLLRIVSPLDDLKIVVK